MSKQTHKDKVRDEIANIACYWATADIKGFDEKYLTKTINQAFTAIDKLYNKKFDRAIGKGERRCDEARVVSTLSGFQRGYVDGYNKRGDNAKKEWER